MTTESERKYLLNKNHRSCAEGMALVRYGVELLKEVQPEIIQEAKQCMNVQTAIVKPAASLVPGVAL